MRAVSSTSQWQCEECGSPDFIDREGWRWCRQCGIGTQILEHPRRVPGVGNNTHYAPENKLCFGNDLGNPAVSTPNNPKAIYNVLGRRDKKDLGIRVIGIRGECMKTQETVILQRMKTYGSNLCKDAGLQGNFLLANALGSDLRWIATLLTLRNDGRHGKDLSIAAFLLNVQKFCGEEKANALMKELWGREEDGVLVVPESKTRFLSKAKHIIELEKLLL